MIKKQTMIFPYPAAQVGRALRRAIESGELRGLRCSDSAKDPDMQLLYMHPGCKHPDQVSVAVTDFGAGLSNVSVTIFSRIGKIDWDPANRLISAIFNAISALAPTCAD